VPVINQVQTADAYADNAKSGVSAAIISQVYNSRGGWFSVSAAAVFCQMQYGGQGAPYWTSEVLLGNGAFAYLDPKCIGVRFRSAVGGVPGTVTAQISQGDEPPLSIVALGQLSVVGLSLIFQHNDLAAGTEPILDFEDAAGVLTWTLTDDVPGTRMKVTPAFTSPALFPGDVALGGDSTAVFSRLAAATPGIGAAASAFSTGPLNNGRSTIGVYLERSTGRVLTTGVSPGPTTSMFATAVVGDTGWRWTMDSNGVMTWGTGVGGGDTTLQRSGTVPPSSGQVGLTSQQAFQSTNTTGGFVYTAAANNSAFLSFAAAADAQPMFKVFTQGALEWGPGGAGALDLELARVTNSPSGTGTFLELLIGAGLGYGTGTGGTVTQATNLSTGVTLNKPSGQITLFSSAISGGLVSSFTLTNSCIGADDTVVLSFSTGAAGINAGLIAQVSSIAAGSCVITHVNVSGGSLASGTRVLNFAVIKGAVA
jgi:hypothetical protein